MFFALAKAARASRETADSMAGLEHANHRAAEITFPNGCHVAEVEKIDPNTGGAVIEALLFSTQNKPSSTIRPHHQNPLRSSPGPLRDRTGMAQALLSTRC